MSALKDYYSQYRSEYLLERRALGAELSDEAHRAIEQVFEERGEHLPLRTAARHPVASDTRTMMEMAATAMRRVIAFLTTPASPLWRYCVVAGLLAQFPSMVVVLTAMLVLHLIGIVPRYPEFPPMSPFGVLNLVLITPAAETVLLGLGLWLLGKFIRNPIRLAATSAVAWGVLHGMVAPIWFFGTVWSFFVFSNAYIAWRQHSRTLAFIAAAVPHALVNLAAAAMVLAGGEMQAW